jgi:predicted amidohydrolase YtcJ
VHPDDVPRFAALGVTASVQPAMVVTDEQVATKLWGDRIERSYAYGTLHRAGARLAGGSDAPVEALDPLDGIRAAVLREWRPRERLTLDMALRAWTEVPAWLEGREATHGRLEPGRAADLGHVLGGRPLVAGRVGRVEADQPPEVLDRLRG